LLPKTATHGFGTRVSGNGRDIGEIKKYLSKQHMAYSKLVDPVQQHTDRIVVVDSSMEMEIENCDGLITDKPEIVLTVITADCAPIIYSDMSKNIIGISHNGRKGTELKLAQKMIKKYFDLGSTIRDLRVAIGPAIGACCYPMNLIKENFEQLVESGLKQDQIDFFPFCTKCDSKRFFSYRNMRDISNFPEQLSFIVQ